MGNKKSYIEEHPGAYRFWVGFGCFVVYFILLLIALWVRMINEFIMVRPALGLTPPMVLYFGWPGLVGCLAADVLTHIITGYTLEYTFALVPTNFIYNVIPFVIWYLVFRKSQRPYPRLDTAAKMTLVCILFALSSLYDAAASAVLNFILPIFPSTDSALVELYFNNDYLFSLILGIPLVIALEKSPLPPLPPVWIHVPYKRDNYISLTQQLILLMLFIAVAGVMLIDAVDYTPRLIALANDATLDLYIGLTNDFLSTSIFHLVIILMLTAIAVRYLELHFSRQIEMVANSSLSFVDKLTAYRRSKSVLDLTTSDIDTKGMRLERNVATLVKSENIMRADLVNYINELEKTTANSQRVATELSIATHIQAGAVPHDFSSFRDRYHLDIATLMRPAREVGGDFYDVIDVGPGRVGFMMADVSGKGISAALFMMRSLVEIREQMKYTKDIGEALTLANQALCEHNEAMLFVTVFAGILDTQTGQLTYANAGHTRTWYRSSEGGQWLKAEVGLVMGIMDMVNYETESIVLAPGDGLFLYTDGVTEAINSDQELFGEDRLEVALREIRQSESSENPVHAKDVVDAAIKAVDTFAGAEPQFDDITMMSLIWDLPVTTIQLPPNDSALPDLFAFAEPFCKGEERTPRMKFEVDLILEELFVNIAHYGFPEGHVQQPVSVQIGVDEVGKKLHLTLSDSGVPYDPLSYESQKLKRDVEHDIGGLGLLLVREMADEIFYERSDELNIVHIVKSFV